MKILIYGINYAPELTGIGKYSAEMAEWLAARGHSVSVVTAPPYYPQWRVHDGYRAGRYAREERAGVSVRRAPLWVPARPGGVKRLLHLASFALSSLPSLLRAAGRPDVILVVEPARSARPRHGWPPGCAALAPGCTCRTMKWTPRSSWACSRAPGCAAPSPAPSAG